MQPIFASELDIGERLYARSTSASLRKRSNNRNAAALDAAWSSFQEQGFDVKAEVDRMFNSVMSTVEKEVGASAPSDAVEATTVETREYLEPFVIDAHTNSRVAAARALLRQRPLRVYHQSTFGSGRVGMSEPVHKDDGPGPGHYFPADEQAPLSTLRCGSSSGRNTPSSRREGDRQKKPRGFSFGTGARRTFVEPTEVRAKQLSVPGPGEYRVPGAFDNVTNVTGSKQGTFGKAARLVERADASPGPGAYAVDEVRTKMAQVAESRPSAGFLSSSPRMPSPRSEAPGPGTYHQVERGQSPPPVRDTPQYSFPRAQPRDETPETPGPGTYDLLSVPRRDAQTRGVIPLAGRDDGVWGGKKRFEEPGPGPGAYGSPSPTQDHGSLSITMKFRHESDKPPKVPGPGEYDVLAHEEPGGPKWTMASRLVSPEPEEHPGPQDYQNNTPASPSGPSAVFGASKRDTHAEIATKVDLPGPADYVVGPAAPDAQSPRHVVFGTAKQRPELLSGAQPSDVPGPGAYSAEPVLRHLSAPPVATAPRFLPPPNGDVPGPGYYSAFAAALVESKGGALALAKRATSEHFVAPSPPTDAGPGAYELPPVPRGPQFTMGAPLPGVPREADPERGPGAYAVQLSTLGNAPHTAIGSAPRFVEPADVRNAKSVPGPGAYEPHVDRDERAPVLGTASKEPPLQLGAPVGPGAYDPRSVEQDPHRPAASFGTATRFDREKEAAPHPVPGPGSYEPFAVQPGSPAAVFGSAPGHPQTAWTDVPGPGAYVAEAVNDASGPSATFGTAPARVDLDRDRRDLPGPTDYDPVPVAPHVPSPLFNSRPQDATEVIPGPGSYYATLPQETGGPSAQFGTAVARVPLATGELGVPGPGAYFTPAMDSAPSAVVPTAQRFAPGPSDAVPGPGSYAVVSEPGVAVTIGTAPRTTAPTGSSTAAVPGPGAYNPQPVLPNQGSTTINASPRPSDKPSDTPGPGAYTPQSVEAAVHGVLLGGAKARLPEYVSPTPGPGAYDIARLLTAPSVSFPLAPRVLHDVLSAGPGPGAYQVAPTDHSPQAHFLTAPRKTEFDEQNGVPGPGHYQLVAYAEGVAQHQGYTFPQAAQRVVLRSDGPGPGAYQLTLPPQGPLVSIGTAPQHPPLQHPSPAPGPGAYDVRILGPEGPAFTFGSTTREQLAAVGATNVPGPGAYDVGSVDARNGPAFSVGTAPRPGIAPVSMTPGPGAYSEQTVTSQLPAYSVPKALRFPPSSTSDAPGPGAYYYADVFHDVNNLGASLGTAPRTYTTNPSGQDVPGPGAYDLPSTVDDRTGFTMATNAVRFAERVSDVPGPASYYPVDPRTATSPAPTVGTAPRFDRETSHGSGSVPGPGAYSVVLPPEGPFVSFPVARRPFDHDPRGAADLPGPGHYDPLAYAAPEGPAYSFGTKALDFAARRDADLPGPGQYTTSTNFGDDARAALIPPLPYNDADAAFVRRVNATPGPTAYSLPSTLDPRGPAVGTAPRDPRSNDERHEVPGPGAYVTSGVGMFDGPKYSIPTQPRQDAYGRPSDAPGPGAYDGGRALDRVRAGMPVYSFPVAERDMGGDAARPSGTAGPGSYDVSAVPHAGPAYSFPRAQDFSGAGGEGRGSVAPGPGMYYVPSAWGDGGVTIGGKWPQRDGASDVPGPGHYRVHDYDPYSRDTAVGVDFSKGAERPCNVTVKNVYSDMPGPGHYYRGAIQFGDGHGVSILHRLPDPFVERTPGPPDYYHPSEGRIFQDPLSH